MQFWIALQRDNAVKRGLCGFAQAAGAEVIVVFEGISEFVETALVHFGTVRVQAAGAEVVVVCRGVSECRRLCSMTALATLWCDACAGSGNRSGGRFRGHISVWQLIQHRSSVEAQEALTAAAISPGSGSSNKGSDKVWGSGIGAPVTTAEVIQGGEICQTVCQRAVPQSAQSYWRQCHALGPDWARASVGLSPVGQALPSQRQMTWYLTRPARVKITAGIQAGRDSPCQQ